MKHFKPYFFVLTSDIPHSSYLHTTRPPVWYARFSAKFPKIFNENYANPKQLLRQSLIRTMHTSLTSVTCKQKHCTLRATSRTTQFRPLCPRKPCTLALNTQVYISHSSVLVSTHLGTSRPLSFTSSWIKLPTSHFRTVSQEDSPYHR